MHIRTTCSTHYTVFSKVNNKTYVAKCPLALSTTCELQLVQDVMAKAEGIKQELRKKYEIEASRRLENEVCINIRL